MQKNNQIKSKQRVKEHAEVFTNPREVKAMCDLLPKEEIWDNLDSTFLEPAVGTGNFLVEILERKFNICKCKEDIVRAIKSIWAIDIQQDNVDETRKRLLEMCSSKLLEYTTDYGEIADIMASFLEILNKQIICGDSLKVQAMWETEMRMKGEIE